MNTFNIVLGGVQLNRHMMWVDQFDATGKRQDHKETLGGGFVVYEASVEKGRPITLDFTESGWLNRSQVEAVASMRESVGVSFLLQIGDKQFNVMFNDSQGDAFAVTQLGYRIVGSPDDKFKGVLKLITV